MKRTTIISAVLASLIIGMLTLCSCQPDVDPTPQDKEVCEVCGKTECECGEKPEPKPEPVGPTLVTFKGLLEEMVSDDEMTRFPSEEYTQHQASSYDRRSVTPDDPENWFRNDDGWGYERFENKENRLEKVIFEEDNPGVITRIWLTSFGSTNTVIRFYFDGAFSPQWTVSSFDLQQFTGDTGVKLGDGLVQPGNNWIRGSVLYLPIPYSTSCKITIEELTDDPYSTSRYYHINYRRYRKDARVETFSKNLLVANKSKIKSVNEALLNPAPRVNSTYENAMKLSSGEQKGFELPSGTRAISQLKVSLTSDAHNTALLLDSIIVKATFDSNKTVELPLSELAGVGIGGYYQKSMRYTSDGKGSMSVRWMMPYQSEAKIEYCNISSQEINVASSVSLADYSWDARSLYFHARHKEEKGVTVKFWYDYANGYEWNFTRISGGRGVYVGDIYTICSPNSDWNGEGDEKIWVDGEEFPSHYGTGVEDYFSFCGYFRFNAPQSGEPRLDEPKFKGNNTHYRCRFLDKIPFSQSLYFDLEMQGMECLCDLANTVFWYGDAQTVAEDMPTIGY
ncbi:MAG: DUF2961 domain-containing protein [Tidjanibacter sp.]|nr:DUF2961 domain-containing protein [Tidjanibacter sp.]